MSRSLNLLHPLLLDKFFEFKKAMSEAGLDFIVTCTGRSILEQIALYAQGRMDIFDVNKLRDVAGLPAIGSEYNKKVTWTLNSRHVINMFDSDLNNDYSRAFDIALEKYSRPHWNLKVDVNENEIPDYEEAGRIGESVGLEWGGRWKHKDYVHFQLPGV